MNPEYEPYELIDRYLDKVMSQEELLGFEERLSKDDTLQELVEAQKIANEYLIDQELLKLKNRMQLEMGSGGAGSTTWTKVLITSSAVLIAGGALYLLINSNPTPETQKEIIVLNPETGSLKSTSETSSTGGITTTNNTVNKQEKSTTNTPIVSDVETKNNISSNEIKQVEEKPLVSSFKEPVTANTSASTLTNNETKIINCDLIKIEATTSINYGYTEEEEPRIVINKKSIRGGTAPYSFSLDKKVFTTETSFDELKDGTYHVYVRDHYNCISELDNKLVVKKPVKEIDQSFSPASGSRWAFPLKNNIEGTITIFNKAGMIVYNTNITGGYPNDWDGRDNTGKELDSGNYSFIINFANNEFVKGHITIFK